MSKAQVVQSDDAEVEKLINRVIQEVASDQGILLTKDDPILTAVLLNRSLVKNTIEHIRLHEKRYIDQLQSAMEETGERSRELSASILNHALESATQNLTSVIELYQKKIEAIHTRNIEEEEKRFQRTQDYNRRTLYVAVACAVIAALGAGIAVAVLTAR